MTTNLNTVNIPVTVTRAQPEAVTHATIIRTVARYAGVTSPILLGRDKRQPLARYRQIAMYLCRNMLGASYPTIGEWFHRDHTTILYSVRAITNTTDPKVLAHVDELTRQIEAAAAKPDGLTVSVGDGTVIA